MAAFKKMVLIPEREYLDLKSVKEQSLANYANEEEKTGDIDVKNALSLNKRLDRQLRARPADTATFDNFDSSRTLDNDVSYDQSPQRKRRRSEGVGEDSEGVGEDLDLSTDQSRSVAEESVKEEIPEVWESPGRKKQQLDPIDSAILEQVRKYVSEKDVNKAVALTKRLIATSAISFNLDTETVTMNRKKCSLMEFIDLIQLSCSRVKPVKVKALPIYLEFLRATGIPLTLIVNPYIRSSIIKFDAKSSRKGRAAMPPKVRQRKKWFASLEDIDEMNELLSDN